MRALPPALHQHEERARSFVPHRSFQRCCPRARPPPAASRGPGSGQSKARLSTLHQEAKQRPCLSGGLSSRGRAAASPTAGVTHAEGPLPRQGGQGSGRLSSLSLPTSTCLPERPGSSSPSRQAPLNHFGPTPWQLGAGPARGQRGASEGTAGCRSERSALPGRSCRCRSLRAPAGETAPCPSPQGVRAFRWTLGGNSRVISSNEN